jgi:hypothetical protein
MGGSAVCCSENVTRMLCQIRSSGSASHRRAQLNRHVCSINLMVAQYSVSQIQPFPELTDSDIESTIRAHVLQISRMDIKEAAFLLFPGCLDCAPGTSSELHG